VLACQAMHVSNTRRPKTTFEGPYADALATSILRLATWLRSAPAKAPTPRVAEPASEPLVLTSPEDAFDYS